MQNNPNDVAKHVMKLLMCYEVPNVSRGNVDSSNDIEKCAQELSIIIGIFICLPMVVQVTKSLSITSCFFMATKGMCCVVPMSQTVQYDHLNV